MRYKNEKKAPEQAQKFIEEYLGTLRAAGRREQSITTRRHQLVRICIAFNPLEANEADLLNWMGAQSWKPETRKSFRAGIRGFFAWLKHMGYRPDDPALNLPAVHSPQGKARPCPDRYIAEAMRKADDNEAIMLRAAAEYGLRRGEIARLSSDDVIDDLTGKSLIVHGKGGKQRVIPLEDDFADLILDHNGYVFPGRFGGHVEESYVGSRLTKLLPDHWSGHTLRHRFATMSYQRTHDILLVSQALGHASVATTQRYVALPTDALRGMVGKVRLEA
ncbi:tyrosine-type recombinase/integrase [Bifidobacterium sp. ESL0769]|uniref:tyrosine-type recombinase/integrase n=1 Tax=Bifidobacterium sp. ESL0769 TaxID=2983229 RepID=UPI0023F948E0|nr:tyrosine-type recombinase/integrase [Bifidobacterium sp. ESL0769]WEV67978.1 tyrosine-type recombinase/integrase [Bifidobacterium sp. ESL0769]